MSQTSSPSSPGLIFLDRDGVLNEMWVNPDHGLIDSPLHPDQVRIVPQAPALLAELSRAGYGLVIVSNQPSAAKNKTTRANVEAVHQKIVAAIESEGAKILSSHLCFHRSEDHCDCRKPKTGLLEAAWKANPGFALERSWMLGDGITDVQAGIRFGVRTGFIGPRKPDVFGIFHWNGVTPDLWHERLPELVHAVLETGLKKGSGK